MDSNLEEPKLKP